MKEKVIPINLKHGDWESHPLVLGVRVLTYCIVYLVTSGDYDDGATSVLCDKGGTEIMIPYLLSNNISNSLTPFTLSSRICGSN